MDLYHIFYAVILGAVQGLTEFLPVSSSAHLIITSWLFEGKALPLSLNIALHIGTLLAVLVYFKKDWLGIIDSLTKFIRTRERSFESHVLLPGLALGTLPASIIGLFWKDSIEQLFHHPSFVIYPLAIVGLLLWLVDWRAPEQRQLGEFSIKDAILVGVAQAFALIPGTSRSGATIIGARILGFNRESAARFSFLLGTPAMLGAALLEIRNIGASLGDPVFYIGVITAAIVGFLAIHSLLVFVRKFGLAVFAVYRFCLALVLFFIVS